MRRFAAEIRDYSLEQQNAKIDRLHHISLSIYIVSYLECLFVLINLQI
jgi:hypothetical protein